MESHRVDYNSITLAFGFWHCKSDVPSISCSASQPQQRYSFELSGWWFVADLGFIIRDMCSHIVLLILYTHSHTLPYIVVGKGPTHFLVANVVAFIRSVSFYFVHIILRSPKFLNEHTYTWVVCIYKAPQYIYKHSKSERAGEKESVCVCVFDFFHFS